MNRRSVSFNELSEISEIRETPRSRTIEIKQRLKNLVSRTKKTLKHRFPNGIEPLIEEKEVIEDLLNRHQTTTMRQVKRVDEIDKEIIRYLNLKYVIENPKDYIEYLEENREKSGRKEAKIEKRLRLAIKDLSPTALNTSINSIRKENVTITKRNKSRGGKNKKSSNITRRMK